MHPNDSKVARWPSRTVRTRRSKGTPPKSLNHAMRTPLKLRASGRAKIAPGSLSASGEPGSGPAIVLKTNARSSADRPRHPEELSVDHANPAFGSGTRPTVGRKPVTLQNAAGFRSDPPISLPSVTGTNPHASATAAPPDDPPQVFVRSHGFRVVPNTVLKVCDPAPNSGVFVLPNV